MEIEWLYSNRLQSLSEFFATNSGLRPERLGSGTTRHRIKKGSTSIASCFPSLLAM
jgi:hypothetical protein